jgi:hypothetical protein
MVWEQDFCPVKLFQENNLMNKILAAEHIDFADSEYKSFHMSEDDILTLYLKSWDAKSLKIVFSQVIQFLYKLGDLSKDLYQSSNESAFLNAALSEKYIKIPLNHPYKLFELEDIHGFPFIQVVAESVNVIKE